MQTTADIVAGGSGVSQRLGPWWSTEGQDIVRPDNGPHLLFDYPDRTT